MGSIKNKSKGKGVLGHVKGFVIAHEEQGRYMLHTHIQLFLDELSMPLRKLMFSDDEETAKKARVEFLANVDC